jgi:DNA-binding transcriptional ArsR family regulator
LIDYRRLSMNKILDRESAETYAEWFRTLSDATRVQLLAWLARQPAPVPVRDIVDAFPLSQSTVSHHLAALARTCFVTVERQGTSSLYAVNPNCLSALPEAADLVMNGRSPVCCVPTHPKDIQ